mgnify:CR=1 FL=1|jgi:hypothetical protein
MIITPNTKTRDFAVSNDGVVSLIDITPTATVSDVVARSARGS